MRRINTIPWWFLLGLVLPLAVLNGWVALILFQYFQSLIHIVVTALLLAFVLDYPVLWLQRFRLPKPLAILGVLLITLAVLGILGLTLVPIVTDQINELTTRLPVWIESGTQQLQLLQTWAASHRMPVNLSHFINQLETQVVEQLQTLGTTLLGILPNAISSILDILITVILTFYLVLHGERLWQGLCERLPPYFDRRLRPVLRQNFHNYIVSQVTVAALMGLVMTLAFLLIRVPFGLLFGIGIGLLAIFPFGGAIGIAITSVLMALKSIWLGLRVLVVATLLDQLVENAIAPQLIGKFTGLNPIVILVSLLIGAKLAGILGLVIAVPIASVIKTLFDPPSEPTAPIQEPHRQKTT